MPIYQANNKPMEHRYLVILNYLYFIWVGKSHKGYEHNTKNLEICMKYDKGKTMQFIYFNLLKAQAQFIKAPFPNDAKYGTILLMIRYFESHKRQEYEKCAKLQHIIDLLKPLDKHNIQ